MDNGRGCLARKPFTCSAGWPRGQGYNTARRRQRLGSWWIAVGQRERIRTAKYTATGQEIPSQQRPLPRWPGRVRGRAAVSRALQRYR